MSKGMSTVRIGCSSAFWGDSPAAAQQLVERGNIQYLVADYLAEVTMGILAKRRKSTDAKRLGGAGRGGYVAEFVTFVWKPLMADIMERNIKVVTNAGGLDPRALKEAIEQAAKKSGMETIPKVAAVYGDDILPDLDALIAEEGALLPFSHVEGSGDAEMVPAGKKLESFNAYLGAEPIRRALEAGAQIVVTGRCVDSALVLGPLMHEFGWKLTDFDLLASGSLAGHIIECGCQATGGNFTDWQQSAFSDHGGWANMGYPIVECHADGSFVVTKPEGTGGAVTVASVGEQMVYEIGDPGAYILPDVIVDLRRVTLKQLGENRVGISGARGRSPTPYLKVSGIYMDGYKVTGEIFIGGIDASKKGKAVGEAIITRVRNLYSKYGMEDFRDVNVEMLGAEHSYGYFLHKMTVTAVLSTWLNSPHTVVPHTKEIVLRLTVLHNNPRALGLFLMEIAPSATCMAPGIIGVSSGRPRPQGNMVHFSCLVAKKKVQAQIKVGEEAAMAVPFPQTGKRSLVKSNETSIGGLYGYFIAASYRPLVEFCIARSGDKGDSSNIGVIVRDPKYYAWIKQVLSEETVYRHMQHLMGEGGAVKRFELPGCFGLNFLLTRSLGGGGLSSLKIDRQGKTYAQMLLSMRVPVPLEFDSLFRAKL